MHLIEHNLGLGQKPNDHTLSEIRYNLEELTPCVNIDKLKGVISVHAHFDNLDPCEKVQGINRKVFCNVLPVSQLGICASGYFMKIALLPRGRSVLTLELLDLHFKS